MTDDKKLDSRIWRKDDTFTLIGMPEIKMDAAVCEIPEKCVPLSWDFNFMDNPIGQVDNIRLEDGEIIGDVELFDDPTHREPTTMREQVEALWEHDDIRLGGYYTNVVYKDDKRTEIGSCTLRAVAFVMVRSGANPGAKI